MNASPQETPTGVVDHPPVASPGGDPPRILVVTNKPVFPLVGGAALRNWQSISILDRMAEVATFSIVSPPTDWGDPPPGIDSHVLVRAKHLRAFRKWRRKLWWLRPCGHHWADVLFSGETRRRLEEFIDEFRPDLIVLEELWLHEYLPALRKAGCPLVYDAHNIESSLVQQGKGGIIRGAGPGSWHDRFERRNVANIERKVVAACDQVWVCSENDRGELSGLMGRSEGVHVVPNGVNVADYADGGASGGEPGSPFTMVYTATFSYAPNVEASRILIDEVFPAVRERIPGARLLLVGNRPTAYMQEAAAKCADIVVTGRVPEVTPYIRRADVVVVPLRTGGGTRLKILEAFATGVPVISTAKGAEGIELSDGTHALIRDEVGEMVDAVVSLAEDPGRGGDLAREARRLVEERYSWEAIARSVSRAIGEAVAR